MDADADFDGGGVEEAGGGAEIERLRGVSWGISYEGGREPTVTAMPAQFASSSSPEIERFLSLPEIVQNPYGHSTCTAWGAIFTVNTVHTLSSYPALYTHYDNMTPPPRHREETGWRGITEDHSISPLECRMLMSDGL